MLDKNIFNRPSVAEIISCEWLNDPYVKAITHLEKIAELEKTQQ